MKPLAILAILGLLPLMAWVVLRMNRLAERAERLEGLLKTRAKDVETAKARREEAIRRAKDKEKNP